MRFSAGFECDNGNYTRNSSYVDGIEIYQSISAQIKDELAQSPDVEALKLSNPSVLEDVEDEVFESNSLATEGWALVKNYSFFTNLASCGYCEVSSNGNKVSSGGSGICGYIAAGMLITYDTVMNGKGYITTSYYSKSGNAVTIKSALPYALYRKGVALGYGTATDATKIKNSIESFFEVRSVTVSHKAYTASASNYCPEL